MEVEHTDHSDEDELLLPLALGVFPVDVIIIILFQIFQIVFPGDVSSPQFLDPHRGSDQAHCALLRSRRRLLGFLHLALLLRAPDVQHQLSAQSALASALVDLQQLDRLLPEHKTEA